MEWVVDTGQPLRLAINNQEPAASSEAIMPNTNSSGRSVMGPVSIMPLRIVEVTYRRGYCRFRRRGYFR